VSRPDHIRPDQHETDNLTSSSWQGRLLLEPMFDGEIEHDPIDNKPCASLAAVDAYRRRQTTRAGEPEAAPTLADPVICLGGTTRP